jgi:excisionase family DNA binding protein
MPGSVRATVDVPIAAERLGVTAITLYKAIRQGTSEIPYLRVGRRILIPVAELDRLCPPSLSDAAYEEVADVLIAEAERAAP